MASQIDNAFPAPPSDDDLDPAPGGRASRKRAREFTNVDDIFDETFDLNDDGRPKTRRVNPQRLAIRLGPDLVAEMEALIVPGAKMPPFAVRKDFQERYCVDRRHIYDYFHSRGLRVSKEDKHTNLIRGRAAKAAAAAAAATATSTVATPDVVTSTLASQVSTLPAAPQNEVAKDPVQRPPGGPKPIKSLKVSKRRKRELPKARRSFLAPSTGDVSSRDSTLSPISEPTFSLGSTPSLEDDWASQDSSGNVISAAGGQQNLVAPGRGLSDRAYLGPQGQVYEFVPPMVDSGLDLLLAAEAPSLLDSSYYPLADTDQSAQADPPSLDQEERTALYNLVQNSLHPAARPGNSGGLSFSESQVKDWALFSGRLATLNAVNSYYRPTVNHHISECTLASTNSETGDLSSELFDLGGWLSEDLSREQGHGLCSPSASISNGTRAVYLGRYDGHSEPVQMNVRENQPLSGKQVKVRISSSRG